jgi:PKD repeat protein
VNANTQANFVVTNQGGATLSNGIATVTGGPFALVSGTAFNLPGFAATNVVVRFSPISGGAFSNNVTITTANAGNSTNPVVGAGLTPAQLAVSPASLNFGQVAVNGSTQASFVVTNLGGATLSNGIATAAGGPFTIVSGAAFSLPGFAATNVVVRFSPVSGGAFSNNVTITTANAGNSTNPAVGVGLTPAQVAVSPAALDFGLVAVNASTQANFVVTNLGGATLSNGIATVTGGPFAIVSGAAFSLPGFGTTNVVVSFSPASVGAFSNNVIVTTDNAGNKTNSVTGTSAISPIASFTGSPISGAWPLTVSFTNSSTGTYTNAVWDFGGGASSNTTALTLARAYVIPGTNTVKLTVTGPLGTDSLTQTNYVVVTDPAPVVLSIQLIDTQLQLTWSDGVLQSAFQVTGPYTNVPGVVSPYTIAPSDDTRFFRVKVR